MKEKFGLVSVVFIFGLMTAFLVCSVGLNIVLLDKNVQIMRTLPMVDGGKLR